MNYISNLKGMFFHLHYILCIKYLIYRSYKVRCKEYSFFQNALLYINHNYLLNCISNNSPHILNNFTQLYSMHLGIWCIHYHNKSDMVDCKCCIFDFKGMFFHPDCILCIQYLISMIDKVKCKKYSFFQCTLLYIIHNYLLNYILNNCPHILNSFTHLDSMHLDI